MLSELSYYLQHEERDAAYGCDYQHDEQDRCYNSCKSAGACINGSVDVADICKGLAVVIGDVDIIYVAHISCKGLGDGNGDAHLCVLGIGGNYHGSCCPCAVAAGGKGSG